MAKTSAAQQRAVHKYVKNNYDRLELSVPKGEKVTIQQAAKQAGQSVNAYMQQSQGVEALQMLIGGFVIFMIPQVVGSVVVLLELTAVMLRQVWYI